MQRFYFFPIRAIEGFYMPLAPTGMSSPIPSTTPPENFLHAEKLKYLICCSKNNIWKMHSCIHLKDEFHFATAVSPVEKGKSLSGGEKARPSTETLRCQNELQCCLLLLWLLIYKNKLSPVAICLWDVNLYLSSFSQLWSYSSCWYRDGWTFPVKSQLENIFGFEGHVVSSNYSTLPL